MDSGNSKIATAALVSEQRGLLATPLERLIGKRSANKLAKLGLQTVSELLGHVPFRLARRGELMPIQAVREGEAVTVVARVLSSGIRPMHARRGFILNLTVTDGEHDLDLTFFSKNSRPLKFHEMQLSPGTVATFSGTISSYRGKLQLTHPEYNLLESEDAVDEQAVAAPIPIYHASAAVPSWKIEQAVQIVLGQLKESDVPDPLPPEFRQRYDLPSKYEALLSAHAPTSLEQWQRAKLRMAYEEAFVLQTVLARRRARALSEAAQACAPSSQGAAAAFERQLPFALTQGQLQVGEQIAQSIASTVPMRLLLQGDVGTGKTIVALRAMLQVIDAGGQAVLIAPTEVLARQHFETFQNLLGELAHGGEIGAPKCAVRLELLTGSLSQSQQRSVLARIASGESQLIVGTHALLYDRVQLPNLALVVVDEQHRFGVDQRDRLAAGAHLLVMTATPIPRTIAMTSFGDLDVATLKELPQGRAEISTTLVPAWNERWLARVWQRAREEVEQGGRVYVVCPRISASDSGSECDGDAGGAEAAAAGGAERFSQGELEAFAVPGAQPIDLASVESVSAQLRAQPALAGIQIGQVHGRMDPAEKAAAMEDFAAGRAPILVATTVIEVGIDVPAATMMVILDAERFGLSQLHQLRGRIGRGSQASICLAVHHAAEGTLAYERLAAFAATTDGFVLAEKDLELRSEGDVLGAEQSGTHSSLRFLSVLRDGAIIEAAKEAAAALVTADPELADHPQLCVAVTALESTAPAAYIERT